MYCPLPLSGAPSQLTLATLEIQLKMISKAMIRTQAGWGWSMNATSVPPRPPIFFFSTALTSAGWVQMTIEPCTVHHLSSAAVIKSQQHRIIFSFLKKFGKHWESNPGQLGVERERYRCAMPTPQHELQFENKLFANVSLQSIIYL